MVLIADSGSTKTDWVLLHKNSEEKYSTAGFNPFFHNEAFILAELGRQEKMNGFAKEVKQLFFYGASCSSEARNAIIRNALQKVFINAKIHVDHDLAAAAFAVYEGEPCIAAIVGTGSNSCYFDGKNIYEEVPALGYILGDEGSGSYFGKALLRNFLYHRLPENIHLMLTREYGLTKEIIFENVYSRSGANVYLASFFKVLATFKQEKFVKDLIAEGMKDFLENHICCYKNYKSVPSHFVGSVGFIFEDVLRKTAGEMEISIGKVIKQPIDGLVGYHKKFAT